MNSGGRLSAIAGGKDFRHHARMKKPDGMAIEIDAGNLYREDTFTDLKAGTLVRLTPVTADGRDDAGRPVQFIGRTQILTEMGALPIEAPLKATTLAEAVAQFPQAVEAALDELARRIEQRQREAASRIVTPGQLARGPGGPGPGNLII
jgi:hypothetical protein